LKPLVVRRKEAARLISAGTSKIDELVARSLLDARKHDKILLITLKSIEQYLESLPPAKLALPQHLRDKQAKADAPRRA
jgi:hypothetical protein